MTASPKETEGNVLSAQQENSPASRAEPRHRISSISQKWWVLLTIGTGTFMSALDGSIVNISLPTLSKTFQADVASIEWVVTVYLLVLSSLLLSFGRLGDMRGHKTIYTSGFFIFILGSALCGLSWSVGALVVFRGLQALGAAMLMANSPAILTKNFPASQRGQALGIQATMTYLGLTVGPSLGGWLTTHYTWRSVFYINIPVGLLALWASSRFIPADLGSAEAERFDIPGAVTFLAGLIALLLGLNQGHDWGWTSPGILTLLAAAFVLLGLFLVIESRVFNPMLDLSLFRHREFSLPVISAILNYISIYSIIFLLPFYLIRARGFSPAEAGLLLTAQPIAMAVVAPISGTLSDKIGIRLPGTMGMILLALGMFLLGQLGPQSSSWQIVVGLVVSGLGTGIFISPNTSALMGAAPRNRQGIAAGILATSRNVGMVLGVGFAGAIFSTVLAQAGIHTAEINPLSGPGLFSAFQISFYAAAGVAALGGLTSVIRQ